MKVSSLKAKVSRIWIEIPGENEGDPVERIWIDYRPGELTLAVADELKEAVATGFESDMAKIMLTKVLADWDLQNEDGSPMGVSEEEVKSVPLTFLGLIMAGIEADSRPNAQRDVISGGGSPQTEQPDPSLNGTSSSERQTGSLSVPGNS